MQKSVFVSLFVIGTIATTLTGCTARGNPDASSEAMRNGMEIRLQQLEDREAIRQLLMDYGQSLDRRDFASFSQLFAERDGEWDGGMGKAKGPAEIRKLMETTIGKRTENPGPPNFHIFTNETIRLNGDRADATTKWIFVIQGDAGRPQPVYLGHYEDSMIRENGRWKFQRRVVHTDIPGDEALSRKQ